MSQSETKQKLINIAIYLFSKKGYFNTKVSDIVKKAGVAQGTFYIYFKSKEDIFLFIIKSIVNQIEEIVNRNINLNIPVQEKIYKFGKETYTLLYQYKEIGKIFFFQLLCVDEKYKNIYISTDEKVKKFYLHTFESYPNKELISDIFLSFGKRIFEFSILIQDKNLENILKEFEAGIKLIFRGLQCKN